MSTGLSFIVGPVRLYPLSKVWMKQFMRPNSVIMKLFLAALLPMYLSSASFNLTVLLGQNFDFQPNICGFLDNGCLPYPCSCILNQTNQTHQTSNYTSRLSVDTGGIVYTRDTASDASLVDTHRPVGTSAFFEVACERWSTGNLAVFAQTGSFTYTD